jgi:ABC-type multidrug transport system fused ATPase/permease subunit
VTEITGSETFVHLDHHGDRWVGLVHGVRDLAIGSELTVYLDPSHVYIFSKDGNAGGKPRRLCDRGLRSTEHGKITLDNLAHSYLPNPPARTTTRSRNDHVWADGEAYALLGASGCGKTTLLNIISGLLHPSRGRILFGDEDVTDAPTAERNIAQVFQFPVVYDTMTVRDNLAFPLRNRGADRQAMSPSGCRRSPR